MTRVTRASIAYVATQVIFVSGLTFHLSLLHAPGTLCLDLVTSILEDGHGDGLGDLLLVDLGGFR
jgi:hypothetical protein